MQLQPTCLSIDNGVAHASTLDSWEHSGVMKTEANIDAAQRLMVNPRSWQLWHIEKQHDIHNCIEARRDFATNCDARADSKVPCHAGFEVLQSLSFVLAAA